MKKTDRYNSLIQYYAEKYRIPVPEVGDWRLIHRQVIAESYDYEIKDLNPHAVSPAGAKGLMQFMPKTWLEWDDKENIPACDDPFNPEENIEAGCKYMAHLWSCYREIPDPKERYKFTLAAYNAGRGNINEALAHARKAVGQPFEFSEWEAIGRPPGTWQLWKVTSRMLHLVTGEKSKETIGYVAKICIT